MVTNNSKMNDRFEPHWFLLRGAEQGITPNLTVQFTFKDTKGSFIALSQSMIVYVTEYTVYCLAEDGSKRTNCSIRLQKGQFIFSIKERTSW